MSGTKNNPIQATLFPQAFLKFFELYLDIYTNQLEQYKYNLQHQPSFTIQNRQDLIYEYPLVFNHEQKEKNFNDFILFKFGQLYLNKKLNESDEVNENLLFSPKKINPTMTQSIIHYQDKQEIADIIVQDNKGQLLDNIQHDQNDKSKIILQVDIEKEKFQDFINKSLQSIEKSHQLFSHFIGGAIMDYENNITNKEIQNKNIQTVKGKIDNVYYSTNINPSNHNLILDKDILDYIEERLMNIDKFSNEQIKCNLTEHLTILETFYTMKEHQPTYKKMRDDFLHKSLEKNIKDLNFNLDGYKIELKQLIFDNNDLTNIIIDNKKMKQTKNNKQKP